MRAKYLAIFALSIAAPQLAQAQSTPASTVSSEPIDPARLEAAKRVVSRILPDGTYAKVMEASVERT